MTEKSEIDNSFSIHMTEMIKGIGLLLMIFHHLFWNLEHTENLYETFFLSKKIISIIAILCRVCVPLFLFVSGYGLSVSRKSKSISTIRFIYKNEVKLFLNYAFVFIISILFGYLIKKISIPMSWDGSILAFITDFFGLAYLFNLHSVNDTWWYISFTYILYLIFPLLNRVCKKNLFFYLAILLSLNFFPFYFHSPINVSMISGNILSFGLGILFANYDIFSYIPQDKIISNFVTVLLLLLASVCIWRCDNMLGWTILSLTIIFAAFTLLKKLKIITLFLQIVGKHSMTGYIIHNFILYIYFEDVTYSFIFPIFIYLFVVLSTLSTALLIDWLKKTTKYDILVSRIIYI